MLCCAVEVDHAALSGAAQEEVLKSSDRSWLNSPLRGVLKT